MKTSRLWDGQWVWSGAGNPHARNQHEMVLFRRTFSVPTDRSCRLLIHVTADSRYRLYVNGVSMGIGPCKGTSLDHYYESIDVSEKLRPGRNVIAVKALHYAEYGTNRGPLSIARSPFGGFLLDGTLLDDRGDTVETLHSDERWRCCVDQSLTFSSVNELSQWMGAAEEAFGDRVLFGWTEPLYDDSDWANPVRVFESVNPYGILSPWRLSLRPIPQMYEDARMFSRLVKVSEDLNPEGWAQVVAGESDLQVGETLAPGSYAVINLDAGSLTTGYPVVEMISGKDSVIEVMCAESYVQKDEGQGVIKGVRDDASGDLDGSIDTYHVAGVGQDPTRPESYEPFWFRTFRFVRLTIRVGDQPLTVRSVYFRETGYPLDVQSEFECSDPAMGPLWEMSLRTLARCMHETYEDCPFYEQLQYAMDTMLECLYTYHVSSDDRLARRAIHDFHSSLLPDGMLQSRYPSIEPQVIPGFSLYWIFMLHDHFSYFGDVAFMKSYLPTVDAVIQWFQVRLTSDGLVGVMPAEYWPFVDWVAGWPEGVPVNGRTAPITVYSLMYVKALQSAAQLNDYASRADVATTFRERAAQVASAVRQCAWNEEIALFQDSPGQEGYSQHAQIWAVLADVVRSDEATALMTRTLDDATLSQASYAMKFFLFRALAKAGLYERSFALWDAWRAMVGLNLTTWVEDPVGQRSDCHGWGAVPLYDFTAEILGVKPGAPGYGVILVEPKPGPLTWASGKVITPHGLVSVAWRIEAGQLMLEVEGPPGIPMEVKRPELAVNP